MAHTGEEREVEQLGQLGPDLAGVGVDRVPAREHEVERAFSREGGGQRLGRRERVGTGERGVGHVDTVDVDAAIESPRDRLAQRVFGRRRTEREDGDARARALGCELDRLAHRAAAVRVQLELDAVAAQPAVGSELHLLELGNLLHQHRDAHQTLPREG